MSGLNPDTPIPSEIRLVSDTSSMAIQFDNGESFELPYEYLRVYSPSAAVRGHGVGQGVLQTGKRNVTISGIEGVGNYAVKIIFSDGHDSGLYSWDVLYELATQQSTLWPSYLEQLEAANASRDIDTSLQAQSVTTSCRK